MIDSVGKIAGTFLAVVLLFFAPMLILAQKQEMIMESYVFAKTAYLVEHIRSDGYLSKQMYEQYERQLALTGFLYDIEMEHKKPVYYKEDESGNYKKQYQKEYEEIILEGVLGEEETYRMKRGDLFFIKVTSRTKSLADRMKSYFFIPTDTAPAIQVELGGLIRDETAGL